MTAPPAPYLWDVETNAITVAWLPVEGASKYEVQMKDSEAGEWKVLSAQFSSTMLRKKNLCPDSTYWFRYRAGHDESWGEFSPESACCNTLKEGVYQSEAPEFQAADGEGLTIKWDQPDGVESYQAQYRSELDLDWTSISANLTSGGMRKKNLDENRLYYFRIKPTFTDGRATTYSRVGGPFHLVKVSPKIESLFGRSNLITNANTAVPLKQLGGKVVGLYFSASWCPPCQRFTPQLAEFYNELKAEGEQFEVIFVSLDRDPTSMAGYFHKMPWLALPFEDNSREKLAEQFHVEGIPRLVIMTEGYVVANNAVERPLTRQAFEGWRGPRMHQGQQRTTTQASPAKETTHESNDSSKTQEPKAEAESDSK